MFRMYILSSIKNIKLFMSWDIFKYFSYTEINHSHQSLPKIDLERN